MSKKKQVTGQIKLTIPAGGATPAPPVGPALGQKGVNIKAFCDAFNSATQSLDKGTPVPVIIDVYADKSFDFETKTPPASFYLKQFAKVKKGSSETKKVAYIGKVTVADCEKIAEIKLKDLNAHDIASAVKIIKGSAESMGIEVVDS